MTLLGRTLKKILIQRQENIISKLGDTSYPHIPRVELDKGKYVVGQVSTMGVAENSDMVDRSRRLTLMFTSVALWVNG
eukprot:CAMPEP_0198262360 /NCGR_PEP_ID=MMETSP1447-20131203/10877_1 /TAXON_ID=420782 /ORGANISM="Chaetoceros dichaeta, Strain CCMP1751" /LENGTH=77 /DNA_ID=CAMNT_0043950565 /DNA_START=478 /DNA_END=711 /DNA_ORIENTATION=-